MPREETCSHVHVLPNTRAKFRADIRNSDNRYW